MKFLAIIPARKGSKRIKFKNKKILGKKKLIEYTIDVAKKIKLFSDILVTSDDQEIINLSKKKNILAPWIRPKKLSGSNVSSYLTVKHAVDWFEKNLYKIDVIFLLQPTSPFRTKKNILDALNAFKINKLNNSVISVSKSIVRTQSKKKINIFKPNGSIYIITKKEFFKYKSFITPKTNPFVINDVRESLDIDLPKDWNKALKYISKTKK